MLSLSVLTLIAAAVTACHVDAAPAEFPPDPRSCSSGNASGHGGYNCTNRPATIPVWTAPPTFVKSVKSGKRYLGGSGDDTFHVVHLYSDTDDLYEMGFALGQLFPEEMNDMFNKIEPWLVEMLEKSVPWLPTWLADIVVKFGAAVAIDFVYDITAPYIPKAYLDEWQGIADGANCSIQRIRRVALFPQVSKAACTILLAHKNATTSKGGGVHQLRALDFDPTSYVADFASVVIYHYKTKPKLANFGWIAMTGVLTGMNDVPMSVGQKAWGGPPGMLFGIPGGLPWMQMLRQSLELTTLTAVNEYILSRDMVNATYPGNSVDIHLGFGDQVSNDILGFEVGYNYSKPYHWDTHRAAPTHPIFPGIVYWSKNDDANTMCPADMLKAQYGRIDAEWMAMYYSPNDKTGDTQVAGFDLQQMKVWLANSRKSTTNTSSPMCAYYRQRTLLDMKALFGETA